MERSGGRAAERAIGSIEAKDIGRNWRAVFRSAESRRVVMRKELEKKVKIKFATIKKIHIFAAANEGGDKLGSLERELGEERSLERKIKTTK